MRRPSGFGTDRRQLRTIRRPDQVDLSSSNSIHPLRASQLKTFDTVPIERRATRAIAARVASNLYPPPASSTSVLTTRSRTGVHSGSWTGGRGTHANGTIGGSGSNPGNVMVIVATLMTALPAPRAVAGTG